MTPSPWKADDGAAVSHCIHTGFAPIVAMAEVKAGSVRWTKLHLLGAIGPTLAGGAEDRANRRALWLISVLAPRFRG